MNRIFYLFVFCALIHPNMGQSQNVEWAYSFPNPTPMESITAISTNTSNRFAMLGTGNQGTSLDPLNLSASFNSPGNFVACYNENAAVQWVNPTAGNAFGVKLASDGSVYITGTFSGSQDFDPGAGSSVLVSAAGNATYLQKFNSDGSFAWAVQASVDGNPTKIELLADGRAVVAGRSDVSATVTLSNNSTVQLDKGLYLLEVSANGSLDNAFGIAAPDPVAYMYVFDLSSDAASNIYVGGSLDGVADFDLGSGVSSNALTNGYDAFVVKYNASFGLQWFHVFGDNNNPVGWDKTRGISFDNSSNVYLVGEFTWTTDFDQANPGNFVLTSATNSQVPSGFIMKMTSDGAVSWVKKIGNSNDGQAQNYASVALTGIHFQNDFLYTGIEGEGNWDLDPSANNTIVSVGATASPGIGFARYSLEGVLEGGFSIDTALSGAGISSAGFGLLGTNRIVTAGKFSKLMDFNPLSGSLVLQTDPNGPFASFDNDLYIAKYSFDGSVGIASPTVSEQLGIYPNPTEDILFIQVPSGRSIKSVVLYDCQGKQVEFQSLTPMQLNLGHLTQGMYWLSLVFENGEGVKVKVVR
jgi:hypothetical protein